jgi:hypothetical protein
MKINHIRLILFTLILIINFSLLLIPNSLTGEIFSQNRSDSIEKLSDLSINEISDQYEEKIERSLYKISQFNENKEIWNLQKGDSFLRQKFEKFTYDINDTESFWALDLDEDQDDYSKAYYQLEATLVAISSHSYIFVENSFVSSYEGVNGQGNALSESFDEVYEREVPFFGSPSDVDNNQKIIVLILNVKVNSNNVAGFFSPLNWFPKSEDPSEIDFYSNHADLIYIDVDHVSGSGLATLAHEFQHLIQFNMDDSEDVWLDEGLSMYAEKLTGHDNTISDYVNNFNGFGSNIDLSLTYWRYENLNHYGASYLFLLYLSDRFGKNIISQISNDVSKTGMDSIESILTSYDSHLDIREIFQDWAISLAINDDLTAPYFFYNYSNTVEIHSTWEINKEEQFLEQKINHWGNDIINLSSTIDREYWLTFRAEQSIWNNSFDRSYHINLVQYDSSNNTWIILRINHSQPISLTMNSKFTRTYLIISSTTGTSSGYYPAEPPINWYSNYHLYIQTQISSLPLVQINILNETATRIIIPFPQTSNGTNCSVPIITDVILRIHNVVNGRIIRTFNTLLWDNQGNYFYYEIQNDFIKLGDYFLSAKLSSAGKSVVLYSLNWIELLPDSSITISQSSESNTGDSMNINGFLLIMLVISLSLLSVKRRYY